jgi:hypothetical protein
MFLEDSMKRSAVTAVIAAIGLMALSAAPASAAPVQRLSIPETCEEVFDQLFCFEETMHFSSQTTRTGLTTFVGKTEFRFTVYDVTKENLLLETSGTNHFQDIFRKGDPVVIQLRETATTTFEGTTCTTSSSFMLTGGEVRHEGFRTKCL